MLSVFMWLYNVVEFDLNFKTALLCKMSGINVDATDDP